MYPPQPWDLRGQLHLSVFAVPRADLPALPPPLAAAVRPIPFGGRALVGAAWVSYEPGGVLEYRELLAAVLVHERGRPRVSITRIWVDSVASRDGGRELWGIPKDLAELELRTAPDGHLVAAASTGPEPGDRPAPIASAAVRRGPRLPGRWPTPLSVAQALAGSVVRTPVRGRAGLRLGSATWRIEAGGPLGHLAGRRPLLTVTLTDFRLRFGAAAPASAATWP
ncbi:acetoacetate decarboxylase family protein [Amorphoplanes nipponensis]|uniref:Acetoacetate decarboxylase n=1 Tax=Actinoplanes nipponensis TaxID=135950 RepID=A0A919JQW6_9ACTN|nr:acetoacetate decarboxylase family protein [Actinoplanes nipponensis]GIE53787.1 acetoacetate decarboxylase [Actinoplanes nipponensis]